MLRLREGKREVGFVLHTQSASFADSSARFLVCESAGAA
jgi:hypothetical protein